MILYTYLKEDTEYPFHSNCEVVTWLNNASIIINYYNGNCIVAM